jgi:hypothetical protein
MRWIIALAALLLPGHAAHAEYGATRWGMTPDEVVAAVGGDAKIVRDKKDKRVLDHKRLVASNVEVAGLVYEVSYFFGKDGKGLTMVDLVPSNPETNCAATRAAFTERLGKGVEEKRPAIMPGLDQNVILWRTGPGEEIVEYIEVFVFEKASHCKVLYQQRDLTTR